MTVTGVCLWLPDVWIVLDLSLEPVWLAGLVSLLHQSSSRTQVFQLKFTYTEHWNLGWPVRTCCGLSFGPECTKSPLNNNSEKFNSPISEETVRSPRGRSDLRGDGPISEETGSATESQDRLTDSGFVHYLLTSQVIKQEVDEQIRCRVCVCLAVWSLLGKKEK